MKLVNSKLKLKLNNSYLIIAIVLLLASFSIRIILFYPNWGELRHSYASKYGSTAIGLYKGQGLTYNSSEVDSISHVKNNFSGNFLEFYNKKNREKFLVGLPGPPLILCLLWKLIPVNNFAPLIWLQILLDSILIFLFYSVFYKEDKKIFFIVTILMILNFPVIKRTLMVSYDFWPQFCILVNFIGIAYSLKNKKNSVVLFITGILTAFTIWCRSITNFLPFFITILLFFYFKYYNKIKLKLIIFKIVLYILPVILSLCLLSSYRYYNTGNARPTRTYFWHAFFAGVGQFSNPYNLKSKDADIWNFGKKLNTEINKYSISELSKSPNNIYEKTLKNKAKEFIKRYPHLFIRNVFYRIGIMISPFLYKGGDFIPDRNSRVFLMVFRNVLSF